MTSRGRSKEIYPFTEMGIPFFWEAKRMGYVELEEWVVNQSYYICQHNSRMVSSSLEPVFNFLSREFFLFNGFLEHA